MAVEPGRNGVLAKAIIGVVGTLAAAAIIATASFTQRTAVAVERTNGQVALVNQGLGYMRMEMEALERRLTDIEGRIRELERGR